MLFGQLGQRASGMNALPTKEANERRGFRWLCPRFCFVVGFSRDALRQARAKGIGHECLSYKIRMGGSGFGGFSRVAALLLALSVSRFGCSIQIYRAMKNTLDSTINDTICGVPYRCEAPP
jgi:hypothetical protein